MESREGASQNARARPSVWNLGSGRNLAVDLLRLVMNGSLLSMHVAGGNDSDSCAAQSQGKRDVQWSTGVSHTQGVKTAFAIIVQAWLALFTMPIVDNRTL